MSEDVEIVFDPTSLQFGDVEIGTSSEPLAATLTNVGVVDATGLVFNIPPDTGFEADTAACDLFLGAGESCDVVVTFTPPAPGPADAELEAETLEAATATLSLAGNGVEAPEPSVTPIDLAVDPPGLAPEANSVFEPGETVDIAPAWRNDGELAQSLTGVAASFTGPEGAAYSIDLDAADYGLIQPGETAGCLDTEVCYRLSLDDPTPRPAAHWDATFDETLDAADETTKTWTLHVGESFDDVPATHSFYPAIETLLHRGVTGGCTAGSVAAPSATGTGGGGGHHPVGHGVPTLPLGGAAYCPGGVNTRSQMPVFMLRALDGPDYMPPDCTAETQEFDDVPATHPFCSWIEELFRREVVSGCGDGNYCAGAPVTRAQMAVFLLRTLEGADYTPIECTGRFDDVPCTSLFADWIEELAAREITGGCTATSYCPGDPVTRAQMAVFVTRTFGLTLYGP